MTENPAILKDKAVQRVADAGVGKSNVYMESFQHT